MVVEEGGQLAVGHAVDVRDGHSPVAAAAAGDVQQRSIHGQPAEGFGRSSTRNRTDELLLPLPLPLPLPLLPLPLPLPLPLLLPLPLPLPLPLSLRRRLPPRRRAAAAAAAAAAAHAAACMTPYMVQMKV